MNGTYRNISFRDGGDKVFSEINFDEEGRLFFDSFFIRGNENDIFCMENIPHIVNAAGLCICLEGSADVVIGSQSYRLRKGDMCSVLPRTILYAIRKSEDFKGYACVCTPQFLMSFNIPQPFKYGIDFNISSFIAIGLVYLITAIEATGDVTANSMISGLPIEGDSYLKRVSGGVMADGFNSPLAGIFNSFPNSIFAQNNGIIQLTGVASRYVGYYIAAMLVLLGLFPIVGAIFSLMPDPVLGGATLLMFGTVAAAGIRIVSSQEIGRKETLVLAVSLSLGLGVELMPDVLKQAPEAIRSIFSSGITTGGLTAIVANMVIRVK